MGNKFDILKAFGMPLCQYMTNFYILFGMRDKIPFLKYGFHLYWCKIQAFGIFVAHRLW